ncbi:isopentenyl phosphate kinase family protein [Candidatus Bathyarchaeota archaeon]|nr:isopentenyl phosphate kinase family protein [Candidatus Bathyarchaeota archaeon]
MPYLKGLTALKLGGSVITDKNSYMKANEAVIHRLVDEIARSHIPEILIVHGGGSFGHPLARKYRIKEGFKREEQLLGFCKVRTAMIELNRLLVSALLKGGIPAVPVFPCSHVTTSEGRIESIDLTSIRELLRIGLVPVTCGDAVSDRAQGFTILSGDQLISSLSVDLNAHRIVVGVDVDGVFTSDPKTDPNAELVDFLSLREARKLLSSLGRSTSTDVTGGMFGKIHELLSAVEKGIEVVIVNACKPGRIREALSGKAFVGTRIVAGE